MAYNRINDLIKTHRPESISIDKNRVEESLKAAGYSLVPSWELGERDLYQIAQNQHQLHGIRLPDDQFPRDFRDLGYELWRLRDESLAIFRVGEKGIPEGSYRLAYSDNQREDLQASGYHIYRLFVEESKGYYPVMELPNGGTPTRYVGEGFPLHQTIHVFWDGVMEGQVITYTPYFPQLGGLPEDVKGVLLLEVDAKVQKVRVDTTAVILPVPPGSDPETYKHQPMKMLWPDAREAAQAYQDSLVEMGLLQRPFAEGGDLAVLVNLIDRLYLSCNQVDIDALELALLGRLRAQLHKAGYLGENTGELAE